MKHSPREHQRIYLTFYLRVIYEDRCLGYLIDISKEGIMIMSDKPLEEGKTYDLKMKLPTTFEWKNTCNIDRSVHMKAKCLWSKHDDVDNEFYVNGFQIWNISNDENNLLKDLIKEYRIR